MTIVPGLARDENLAGNLLFRWILEQMRRKL
jgi:hypothetical protein